METRFCTKCGREKPTEEFGWKDRPRGNAILFVKRALRSVDQTGTTRIRHDKKKI